MWNARNMVCSRRHLYASISRRLPVEFNDETEALNKLYPCLFLILLPRVAMAQNILGVFLALAAIPAINIFFVLLYSLLSFSSRIFFKHTGLVILWLVLFWFFSSYTTSDILAWTPIFLSIGHSLYLIYGSFRCLFTKKNDSRDIT